MSLVERVNEKSIFIRCICGEGYNNPLNDFTSEKLQEFNQFQNFTSEPCPNCGMQHIFNMNIPETQYEDQEIEELPFMPTGEPAQREQIRGLMFKVRADLKGNDRAAANEAARAALEKKHGKPYEQIVAERLEKVGRANRPERPETLPETPRN